MRRVHLVVIVAIAVVTGACGSSARDSGWSTAPAPGPSESLPGGEGVERILATAAVAELTSARMSLVAEFGGLDDLGGGTASFGVEAAFAADGRSGEMSIDFGDIMEAAAEANPAELDPQLLTLFGDAIEMRFIDSTVYMSSGFWSWLFPVDTPWVAFTDDESAPAETGFDMDTFAADEFLAILRVLDADAAIVGTEEIDGVPTTHIRGRASAAALAELDPDLLTDLDPAGTGALGVDAFDVDVWIGPDDVLRRLRFGVDDLHAVDPSAPSGSFFRFTLDLQELEGGLEITAPPDEEITWLDEAMDGLLGFGMEPA